MSTGGDGLVLAPSAGDAARRRPSGQTVPAHGFRKLRSRDSPDTTQHRAMPNWFGSKQHLLTCSDHQHVGHPSEPECTSPDAQGSSGPGSDRLPTPRAAGCSVPPRKPSVSGDPRPTVPTQPQPPWRF